MLKPYLNLREYVVKVWKEERMKQVDEVGVRFWHVVAYLYLDVTK